MKDPNRFIPSKTVNRQLNIPRSFWYLACAICMLPFLAQWSTQFEKPSQPLIASGAPDYDVTLSITQILAKQLSKEEKLLWVGQPDPGRETAVKFNWLFLIFVYIWLVIPLMWICGALHFKLPSLQDLKALGIATAGIPFFLFGLAIAIIPFVTYRQDLRTIDVLTTAHVFQIVDSKPRLLTSFNWQAFGPIKVVHYSPTRSDVLFAREYSDDKNPNIGFYGIEQSDKVTDILENYLANRKSDNLDPQEHFRPRPPDTD